MTHCLRSLAFNFNPKLVLNASGRTLTCYHTTQAHGPKHMHFMQEVSENVQSSSLTTEASKCLIPVTVPNSCNALATSTALPIYYHYDNVLNQMVVKPLSVTVDDIVLRNSSKVLATCEQLLEQDLSNEVIDRERVPWVVLMETLPPLLTTQIVAFQKSCLPLNELETHMILTADLSSKSHQQPEIGGKPSEEKLDRVFNKLSEDLPRFFVQPMDYRIYHRNLLFINNIRGVTTEGLPAYIQQVALLRLIGRLKFAHVKMEVLKITKHSEDGTIRVRWRIRGISGLSVFIKFWRFKVWDYHDSMDKEAEWYDAFSVFHLTSEGLVYKHVCDKMMPDEEKVKQPSNLAAKLAFLLGAIPRPSMEDLSAVSLALIHLQDYPSPIPQKDDDL